MFLDPKKFLQEMNLKEGMVAADFGCGPGGWTIPLAKFFKRGKVYALDILPEPLEALKNKIRLEGLSNIIVKECDVEKERGTGLPNNCVDLVLISNILFQAENKKAMITEAKRIVKSSGQIIIIDWKQESPFGPKKENIVSPTEIIDIAKSLSLKEGGSINAGDYHYCLLFRK
jgi:ubiquinone/menaquinone biosynthesis C-methylase UbiE